MPRNKRVGRPVRHRKKMQYRNIPVKYKGLPDRIVQNITAGYIKKIAGGSINHQDLNSLQGGSVSERYHMTGAEYAQFQADLANVVVTQAQAASGAPNALGTASAGSSTDYMRADAVISDQIPGTAVLGDGVTATTQSDGDGSSKVATTLYADNKVETAIANGETSKAPSQDAVYDALALKADQTSVDSALALKADLDSPALTGTPTAPNVSGSDSSSKIATTQHVTDKLATLDVVRFKGKITNADTNPNYPAADAGDVYVIADVDGNIGGASGPAVQIGDTLLCIVDSSPSGDDATVGANWVIGDTNLTPSLYALLAGATFTGQLEVNTTTAAFIPPRMTTTEKNALTPANGWVVFDTDLKVLQVYSDSAWRYLYEDHAVGLSFVVGDLVSGVLTFEHNLNTQYPFIQVFDNNKSPVGSIDIVPTSGDESNSSDLTFSSAMQTEMGANTWYVRAMT